jgi:hypothetical protein
MDNPEKPTQKKKEKDTEVPDWDDDLLKFELEEDASADPVLEDWADEDTDGGDDWEDEEMIVDAGDERWDLTEAEWNTPPKQAPESADAVEAGGDPPTNGASADAPPEAASEWGATDWDSSIEWTEEPQEDEDNGLEGLLDIVPPETPIIIGWNTRVDLPRWGIADIAARCSTDIDASTLRVEVKPGDEGNIVLVLQDQDITVPVSERDGELVVRMTLLIANRTFPADLRLRATSGATLVILGRDALAGRFLVDVSR